VREGVPDGVQAGRELLGFQHFLDPAAPIDVPLSAPIFQSSDAATPIILRAFQCLWQYPAVPPALVLYYPQMLTDSQKSYGERPSSAFR